jgi:uncharacterized integral membrane protein
VIRKLISVLVLGSLGLLLVSFAVANRQTVSVSFDPFDQANPALLVALPLYQLIFILLIGGVVTGGCAAWLSQSKWRRRARRAEAEAAALGSQASRRAGPEPVPPSSSAPRLVIPPPAA